MAFFASTDEVDSPVNHEDYSDPRIIATSPSQETSRRTHARSSRQYRDSNRSPPPQSGHEEIPPGGFCADERQGLHDIALNTCSMISPRNMFYGEPNRDVSMTDDDDDDLVETHQGQPAACPTSAAGAGKRSRPTSPATPASSASQELLPPRRKNNSRPTSPASVSIKQTLSSCLSGEGRAEGGGIHRGNSVLDQIASEDDETCSADGEKKKMGRRRAHGVEEEEDDEDDTLEDTLEGTLEGTLDDEGTFTSNELSPRLGKSLLDKAKNRRPAKIKPSKPPAVMDIPDDDSEASLMVLMRYMGCTPRPYGESKSRKGEMALPSGKEFVFDSEHEDDHSTLSNYDEEGTLSSDVGSKKKLVNGRRWTKSPRSPQSTKSLGGQEEGVEVNVEDFFVLVPTVSSGQLGGDEMEDKGDDRSTKSARSGKSARSSKSARSAKSNKSNNSTKKKSKPRLHVDTSRAPPQEKDDIDDEEVAAFNQEKLPAMSNTSPRVTDSESPVLVQDAVRAKSPSVSSATLSPPSAASTGLAPTDRTISNSSSQPASRSVTSSISPSSAAAEMVQRIVATRRSMSPTAFSAVDADGSISDGLEKQTPGSIATTSASPSPLMKEMNTSSLTANNLDPRATAPAVVSSSFFPSKALAVEETSVSAAHSNDTAESNETSGVRSNKENNNFEEQPHAAADPPAFQGLSGPASASASFESPSLDDPPTIDSKTGNEADQQRSVEEILASARAYANTPMKITSPTGSTAGAPSPFFKPNVNAGSELAAPTASSATKKETLSPKSIGSQQTFNSTKKSVKEMQALLSQTREWLARHNEAQKAKSAQIRSPATPTGAGDRIVTGNLTFVATPLGERKVMSNITTKTVGATVNTLSSASTTPKSLNGSITSLKDLGLTNKPRPGALDKYLSKSSYVGDSNANPLSPSSVTFKDKRQASSVSSVLSKDSAVSAGSRMSVKEALEAVRSKQMQSRGSATSSGGNTSFHLGGPLSSPLVASTRPGPFLKAPVDENGKVSKALSTATESTNTVMASPASVSVNTEL